MSEMIEVTDLSKLHEHIRIHDYICTHGYANKPYPDKVKRSGEKLQSDIKKILKKQITIEELSNAESLKFLLKEIYKSLKKVEVFSDQYPFMGPIGNFYNRNNGLLLDLEDIEKVFVSKENFKGKKKYGTLKSIKCGWIAWYTINLVKTSDGQQMEYLVSFNHHKQETALTEVFEKRNKYKMEDIKRKIRSIFVSKRNWHDDDLEKLNNKLPYIPFLKY